MDLETKLDTVRKLRAIKEQLQELRGRFDTRTSACDCCGLTTYQDRTEHQAAQQIDGMIGRADKIVSVLAVEPTK